MKSAHELALSADLQQIASALNPDRPTFAWCTGIGLALHHQRERHGLTITQLLRRLTDGKTLQAILNHLKRQGLTQNQIELIRAEAAELTIAALKDQEIGYNCLREALWLVAEVLEFEHPDAKLGDPAAIAMMHAANDALVTLESS
ncbi:MAG: hypothetical protein WD873_04570 [Candidatus Hydrogenedentales bacterium]